MGRKWSIRGIIHGLMDTGPDITHLLGEARRGDAHAEQRLLELVFGELHRLAAGYMRSERQDHTLQASALVNEAYVRLLGDRALTWESRAHFYVSAARTMRRILIDHSRRHQSLKNSGKGKVAFDAIAEPAGSPAGVSDHLKT